MYATFNSHSCKYIESEKSVFRNETKKNHDDFSYKSLGAFLSSVKSKTVTAVEIKASA